MSTFCAFSPKKGENTPQPQQLVLAKPSRKRVLEKCVQLLKTAGLKKLKTNLMVGWGGWGVHPSLDAQGLNTVMISQRCTEQRLHPKKLLFELQYVHLELYTKATTLVKKI